MELIHAVYEETGSLDVAVSPPFPYLLASVPPFQGDKRSWFTLKVRKSDLCTRRSKSHVECNQVHVEGL